MKTKKFILAKRTKKITKIPKIIFKKKVITAFRINIIILPIPKE